MGSPHRHATGAPAARVLSVGMEKVGLGILVDPQRDDIHHPGFGDAGDAFLRGFHGRQAKVMANDRKGRFPRDTLHRSLWKIALGQLGTILSFQERQYFFG